jgi:rhodanese-related sulfurtransferase
MRYLIIVSLIAAYFQAAAQENTYRDLSVQEFKLKLDSIPDKVLLDLRTPDEIRKGVIPGAVNMDYFYLDFEKQIAGLDPKKTYFLYCAAGGRSTETLELMKKHGFKEVYNLKEGFTGWQKKKFPIKQMK